MTDTMFTRTALTEAAENAGITPDQARTVLEAAGVTVQPEKPALPTEPGSVIIATEVRWVKGEWVLVLDGDGYWFSVELIRGRQWHYPDHITAWTEARVVPVTTTPVALTEDQVGEEWDEHRGTGVFAWTTYSTVIQEAVTATVNAILSKYAAPAEGEPIADAAEPIDVKDVREGDRARVELNSGDEATFTVQGVGVSYLCSRENAYNRATIRTIHLLHREEV